MEEKFKDIFWFAPKSKIQAGEGLEKGRFPFYTSSQFQKKWIDKEQHFDEALIFGTGGSASIHYEEHPFSTSTDCFVTISKNKNVNTKYVYYYLSSNIYLLEQGFKGAGLKHISKTYLEEIKIPLPNLETQNKIVAILDKAKAILDKRDKTITIYDELLQATFLDMFGDPFSNSKNWNLTKIGTNIEFLTSGSRGWAQYYAKSGSLFLRINNLGYNELLLNDIIYVNEPNSTEAIRTVVKSGDVLLSITADLGRTAVIPVNFQRAFINQHIAILRPKINLNSYFLSAFLSSTGGRQLIQKYSKGAAKAGLNFDDIKSIEIFDIPYILQMEFEMKYKKIVQLKNALINLKNKTEELIKSLSFQVFNEKIIVDVDVELEALVNVIDFDKKDEDNKIDTVVNDITFIQRLIDRLNDQEFENKEQYNKAKYILFRIMNEEENIVKQIFQKEKEKIQLTLQNETT